MFTEGKTAYNRFLSLANQLPVVFLPKSKLSVEGSLLMPGIPVSEGTLNTVAQCLGSLPSGSTFLEGELQGTPALITDLRPDVIQVHEIFMLYTAEQQFNSEGCPRVVFKMRDVNRSEFVEVDGCLALVDNDFANEMKGWALVRIRGKECSTQGIVTRCRYYEQYTTEEALEAAAKSYGGLK